MVEAIFKPNEVTSDILVDAYEKAKRAAVNADLRSRVALQEFEDSKLNDEQREQRYNASIECAGNAELFGRQAADIDSSHCALFGKPARVALRTKILAERRALTRKDRKLSAVVVGADETKRLQWFYTQVQLTQIDNRLELVK